ncbi:MAG: hypothetical protein U0K65_04720 [Negativibacillus sp.]|nr:hypothetical protein [Negativibacillus sp.]
MKKMDSMIKRKKAIIMSVVIRNTVSPTVTTEEQELLQQIHAARRYPVCRFELRCTWEEDLISTALDAVHLTDANESMESVKSRAALLKSLEKKGLLVLFYDLKTFVKSDYQLYHDSAIFHQLEQLAEEGGKREGYLFDYAFVKKGMAILTIKGKYALR